MSEPFLGQITIFAGNFAPRNWAFCNGQLLQIQQYAALFSILGTTYGGNGQTNFALPDLRSRVPIHFGQGAGLSNYVLGEVTGNETVTLLAQQMPMHSHLVNADQSTGVNVSPSGGNLAQTSTTAGKTVTTMNTYTSGTPGAPVTLNPTTIQVQGGSQPHTNIPPVLALNFIIALQGIFPSRN